MFACERKSACDKRLVKTVVNGYEREGFIESMSARKTP